jgi:hypothetical protein
MEIKPLNYKALLSAGLHNLKKGIVIIAITKKTKFYISILKSR